MQQYKASYVQSNDYCKDEFYALLANLPTVEKTQTS